VVELAESHFDDDRTAMRAAIRVAGCKEAVYQRAHFLE